MRNVSLLRGVNISLAFLSSPRSLFSSSEIGSWLPMAGLFAGNWPYIAISAVDRRLTPLAFSLSRQSTVSSRDHEKFLSL